MSDNSTCECPMDGVDLLIQARKDFARATTWGSRKDILAAMDDVRAAQKVLGQKIRQLDHLLGHPTMVPSRDVESYFCNQIADCSGDSMVSEGGPS